MSRLVLCLVLVACKHAEPTTTVTIGGVELLELHPHGATSSSPLVIGMHGKGGSPERFSRLFADFPVAAEIALPRGGIADGNGFAWFAWPPGTTEDGLADAIAATDAKLWPAIVELAHGRPIVVTGFSQGGILAFELAAAHPREMAYAVPIAGMLPRKRWPKGPAAAVYAVHGTADDSIEIGLARDTVAAFRAAGGTAELHELPGVAHDLMPARDDVVAHLRAAVTR
jgi:phospholipase/carboxylesterase